METETKPRTTQEVFAALISGFLIGIAGLNSYECISDKTLVGSCIIPGKEKVQQGYIAPSKLEIKCEDLDGSGEPKTIMLLEGKPYLLKEVNGKPVICSYTLKPAEVVPYEEPRGEK